MVVHFLLGCWYHPKECINHLHVCIHNMHGTPRKYGLSRHDFRKAQGQTIRGNVSLHLGRGKKEHGLSYVAMSRVTYFSNIGLYEGTPYNRLCNSIKNIK